tara:strand:- start:25463 stop:25993 length:531 start_codon:yes stop_codon:yes gene_type:complete
MPVKVQDLEWIEGEVNSGGSSDCMQEVIDNLMSDKKSTIDSDEKEIKEALTLEPTGYPVEVFVIAFGRTNRKNMCQRIPCGKVQPLGNWCYDTHSDQLLVDCAGFQHLGRFNVGYRLRMESVEGWTVDVPLTESIITAKISPRYQEAFEHFKASHPSKDYRLSYVQCSGVFNNGEE